MKRRGWLQLLGLAPVAAAVVRLPEAPRVLASPPPAILLPPRVEVPGYKDLDGMATTLRIEQPRRSLAFWDGRVFDQLGLREVTLDADIFGAEVEWQELIGQLVPVRFSFPKQPQVYVWSGYLTEMQINEPVSGVARTSLEFRGSDLPTLAA